MGTKTDRLAELKKKAEASKLIAANNPQSEAMKEDKPTFYVPAAAKQGQYVPPQQTKTQQLS